MCVFAYYLKDGKDGYDLAKSPAMKALLAVRDRFNLEY
jgi:hypothetical protein